jgi:EAL domain-containing protein (putative c-di-GMP-specific phosphodiesterase class I)
MADDKNIEVESKVKFSEAGEADAAVSPEKSPNAAEKRQTAESGEARKEESTPQVAATETAADGKRTDAEVKKTESKSETGEATEVGKQEVTVKGAKKPESKADEVKVVEAEAKKTESKSEAGDGGKKEAKAESEAKKPEGKADEEKVGEGEKELKAPAEGKKETKADESEIKFEAEAADATAAEINKDSAAEEEKTGGGKEVARESEQEEGGAAFQESGADSRERGESHAEVLDAELAALERQADDVKLKGKSALEKLASEGAEPVKRDAVEREIKRTEKELKNIAKAKKKKTRKRIDFRFRAVLDEKEKVVFVDAYQILNDVYLGKLNVMNYFFIAENSQRINELNFIAITELMEYRRRVIAKHGADCVYCLPLTTRFLDNNPELFSTLVEHVKQTGWEKNSIMFSFNAATLAHIGPDANNYLKKLKRAGYKIVIDGFGEDYNSLDLFSDFEFDYLRLSADYFDKTPQKANLLTMLLRFGKANKIGIVLTNVRTKSQHSRYQKLGVKMMSGKVVSRMSRFITKRFLREV